MNPTPLSSAAACLFAVITMTAAVRAEDTIVIGFGGGLTGSRITLAGASRVALRDVMLIRVEKGAKTLLKMQRPEPSEIPPPSDPLQVER